MAFCPTSRPVQPLSNSLNCYFPLLFTYMNSSRLALKWAEYCSKPFVLTQNSYNSQGDKLLLQGHVRSTFFLSTSPATLVFHFPKHNKLPPPQSLCNGDFSRLALTSLFLQIACFLLSFMGCLKCHFLRYLSDHLKYTVQQSPSYFLLMSISL